MTFGEFKFYYLLPLIGIIGILIGIFILLKQRNYI